MKVSVNFKLKLIQLVGPIQATSHLAHRVHPIFFIPTPTHTLWHTRSDQNTILGGKKKLNLRFENREMAATEAAGKLAYRIYRAVSYSAEPAVNLHLRWRRLRGREHSLRWTERLGLPSLSRPTGPLLWFHAVSLGSPNFSNSLYAANSNAQCVVEKLYQVLSKLEVYQITYYKFEIVGEGITAIPIIKECIKQRPDVNVLMTTTTVSAL